MKTYNVTWLEKMSVNVEAKSVQEAKDIVLNSEHDEGQVSSELHGEPEVFDL